MSLSKVDSVPRGDWATVTKTSGSRGLVINGKQVEKIIVSKLTGDTSGSVALSSIHRPNDVFVLPVLDSSGAVVTTGVLAAVAFTKTNDTTIAVSALGDWTTAILFVTGRSYN